MALPSLTDTLATRAMLGSGDPAEALLAEGKTPPPGTPASWAVDQPDSLLEALHAYAEAGADCFIAPGPAPESPGGFDLQRDTERMLASTRLARQAAGLQRYVMATLSSGGAPADMAHLAAAALQGEADALLLPEPTPSLEPGPAALIEALRAAAPVPMVVSLAFSRPAGARGAAGFHTAGGLSPEAAAEALPRWGADALAVTAGLGLLPEDFTSIVAALRARTDLPILVFLPAGPVEGPSGAVTRPDPPELLAENAWPLIRSGANFLAGGPGTTPAHLSLLKEELDRL